MGSVSLPTSFNELWVVLHMVPLTPKANMVITIMTVAMTLPAAILARRDL